MKLSICVPTRNRPEMVEEMLVALTSLPTDVVDLEILVGDNSTNDDTAKVAGAFPGVSYQHNHGDLGAYGNFNSLVARASGDWVHLIADDDLIDPDYLSGIAAAMEDTEAVIITGRVSFVGDDAADVEAAHYGRLARMGFGFPQRLQGDVVINQALLHGCPFEFSHTIMRRDAIIAVGGFDGRFRLQGDYELWLRMLGLGAVNLVDAHLGSFRVHEGNMLGDLEAGRTFRIERTLIRLAEIARHLDLLSPEIRRAVVREVRRELPRVRAFARIGIGGPLTDGMLSLGLLQAESALRSRGFGSTLQLPLVGLIPETPRSVLRTVVLLLDTLRDGREPGPSADDIGARVGRPLLPLGS